MSSRVPIWYSVTIWCLKPFFGGARERRRGYVKRGARLAGHGAWKVHAVSQALSFEGVCLQPVNQVGGARGEDIDCRSCRRALRLAATTEDGKQ